MNLVLPVPSALAPQRAAVAAGLRADVAAMLAELGDALRGDADEAAMVELAALVPRQTVGLDRPTR